MSLPVSVGDVVRKGQTIARMDPTDYALELQNAQASAAQSRAQERNAKAKYFEVFWQLVNWDFVGENFGRERPFKV